MDAEALGAQPLYFRHLCLHLPLFFHHKQGLLHLYDQGNLSLHPGKSNLHFMILNYAGVEYFCMMQFKRKSHAKIYHLKNLTFSDCQFLAFFDNP